MGGVSGHPAHETGRISSRAVGYLKEPSSILIRFIFNLNQQICPHSPLAVSSVCALKKKVSNRGQSLDRGKGGGGERGDIVKKKKKRTHCANSRQF